VFSGESDTNLTSNALFFEGDEMNIRYGLSPLKLADYRFDFSSKAASPI
jgi:hypothetical protein